MFKFYKKEKNIEIKLKNNDNGDYNDLQSYCLVVS